MSKAKKQSKLTRCGVYPLDAVLPYVIVGSISSASKRPDREYDGKTVHMDSMRYQTFVTKGTKCVTCGLEGEFFALEQHNHRAKNHAPERWHFNLYGIDEHGNEVMLTKDHIKPKSLNGKNALDNYQPMCYPCNQKKGNGRKRPDGKKINRARNLKVKINHLLHVCRMQRKTSYDERYGDGGPVYVALKERRKVLIKRMERLKGITKSLKRTPKA